MLGLNYSWAVWLQNQRRHWVVVVDRWVVLYGMVQLRGSGSGYMFFNPFQGMPVVRATIRVCHGLTSGCP